MVKILRKKDRIKLNIDDVQFELAPLSFQHKSEIASCTKMQGGEEKHDLYKSAFLAIKYSIKDVKGIKTYDDEEYKLDFDGEVLTDDCAEELLNIEISDRLTIASYQLLNGIPKEITNPQTGKRLKGVSLEVKKGGKK